jgi:hypothetical protein
MVRADGCMHSGSSSVTEELAAPRPDGAAGTCTPCASDSSHTATACAWSMHDAGA